MPALSMFMRAQHQIKWSSHALLSLSTAFYRLRTPMHLLLWQYSGHPGGTTACTARKSLSSCRHSVFLRAKVASSSQVAASTPDRLASLTPIPHLASSPHIMNQWQGGTGRNWLHEADQVFLHYKAKISPFASVRPFLVRSHLSYDDKPLPVI